MALWPFGKKDAKDTAEDNTAGTTDTAGAGADSSARADAPAGTNSTPSPEAEDGAEGEAELADEAVAFTHDAINGESGPFDGDSVNIEDFDFTDFSVGLLDLSSMKIPLPKQSQVQVEMGEQGPKMLHIVTQHGRMTPVAFAAPRSSGQWVESVKDLVRGIEGDGLPTHLELGPWGSEVVGENDNGTIRIIGVEGPRWLLRVTLAAPQGKGEQLAALARETIARTFIYRGQQPILAGNSLPVTMPGPLVEQVQKEMERRRAEAKAGQAAPGQPGQAAQSSQPAASASAADAEKDAHEALRNLGAFGESEKDSQR